ncbi:hypothetical protein DesLBE_5323 [Desulfitobacterium sp. LBE]|uniref:ABC-2 family transporter protein n=1 Tax=Desulfitobacterium hafniense (strain Y51) TaxID=138119 RepID=Q24VK4_DESHY|nr:MULTISPECIES: hypothetical protein [Desulfitobacterium]TWH60869.1 hypothetical protein DesLBE_5323 [Desulfitobacterium sp. LBE]BAE83938.1 hypothetical protein DSY2149 [Desulfitobacterium hafniense Y51]
MRRLLRTVQVDAYRAFFSFGFLLAAMGMCLSMFFNISTEIIAIKEGYADVLYLYRVAHLQAFTMLSVLLAALPYGASFCTDWDHQFIRPTVIRSDVKRYSASKVIVSALAGGSAVALGELIFILLLRFSVPLVNEKGPMFQNALDDNLYGGLLSEGHYLLYFAVRIAMIFCVAAFFAVLAFWISTYITNVFVTFASPILAYYFLGKLLHGFGVPGWFNIMSILSGVSLDQPLFSLAYAVLAVTLSCIFIGILSLHQIQRRLEHG